MVRLLGLGDNTIDTYVDRGEEYPGGNAVNVAVLARRMGAEAAFCGCLGNDEAGDLLRAALAAEGVETGHCRAVAAPNARAFIAHNAGDRQFLRSSPGCRAAWGGFSAADLGYLTRFDIVHSSIFSGLEPYRAALRAAIRRWSFDFSVKWAPALPDDWLPHLDVAFLSYPDGMDDDVAALARACAERGTGTVVITRGVRGAYGLKRGVNAMATPKLASVVDTLGAGDAFITAFLLSDHSGAPLEDALDQGATAAAQTCGHFGAFGHGRAWRGSFDHAVT